MPVLVVNNNKSSEMKMVDVVNNSLQVDVWSKVTGSEGHRPLDTVARSSDNWVNSSNGFPMMMQHKHCSDCCYYYYYHCY